MVLNTPSGAFPIPDSVARALPATPPLPVEAEPDFKAQLKTFEAWLDASPDHVIEFERLKRWHVIQEELAAAAKAQGLPFVVTSDGLE